MTQKQSNLFNRRAIMTLTFACLATNVGWSQDIRSDAIYLESGGSTARGRIVDQSSTEIVIETRAGTQRVAVNNIRKVVFGGEPTDMRRARDLVRNGQLDRALESLRSVDVNKVTRPEMRADLQFLLALCQSRIALETGQGINEAAQRMYAFLRSNRDSFRWLEAHEVFGDLAMVLREYSAAAKAYSELRQAPWEDVRLRGALLEASALVADGHYADALVRYDSIIGSPETTTKARRRKRLATVGRAACLAETGKPEEGIATVEEIIDKGDPKDTELFARAYNALGCCYRKLDRPKDALFSYLFVDMLFMQTADAHAEALHYLSGLWSRLNKPEEAVKARNLLNSRYASSRWAI